MKVPPKRKGNQEVISKLRKRDVHLNESPSEKEGKSSWDVMSAWCTRCLNESPSEKEGKSHGGIPQFTGGFPSMKVPPKRKGNHTVESHSSPGVFPQ